MKPVSVCTSLAAAALAFVLGCGDDHTIENPQAAAPHALHGHVNLVGHLVNAAGNPNGTLVVRDADGVRVELLGGTQVVRATTSVDGAYTFTGLAPGAYQTQCRVIGGIGDKSAVFTITNSDLNAGDTLRVDSYGDLYPVPNPVPAESFIYFSLPDTEHVDIHIITVGLDTVTTLLSATRSMGLNQVRWDGLDRYHNPVPPDYYWVTFVSGGDYRAQLLVKENP